MAETTTATVDPRVKQYYDYAQKQIDEQAILDKYNAATVAQYNVQREQNRQAENQFYNQMYNTQKTAMDTIRQANASAVASGASRGVQAANELSALLGLQQESVASATEIAQANRQTAQEETAAVLENVLNAYQQASQERSQLTQQAIEAASLTAQEQQAAAEANKAKTEHDKYLLDLKVNDPDKYYQVIAQENAANQFNTMTDEQYILNVSNATQALQEISEQLKYNWNDFGGIDFGKQGSAKANEIKTSLRNLYSAYGLDATQADEVIKSLTSVAKQAHDKTNTASGQTQAMNQAASEYLQAQFKLHYAAKYNSRNKE